MFRAFILPIFRSTRLCVKACGIMHPRCCRPVTSWVHYTTSCKTQSNAPEDGRNHRPKHVELIRIVNTPVIVASSWLSTLLFQTKVVEKIKTRILCSMTFIENRALYDITRKSIVEPERSHMTVWRMSIASCVPKATDTHSEYITITDFPLQQWLHESASVLHCT